MAILPDLDRTDFEILRLLQKDARLTNKELASVRGERYKEPAALAA